MGQLGKLKKGIRRETDKLTPRIAKAEIERVVTANAGAIIKAIVKKAKAGNVPAAKEAFDRAFGRTIEMQKQGESIVLKIDL